MDAINNKNNVLIYPKFKRIDVEEVEGDDNIALISNHYASQFFTALANHGLEFSENMADDYLFLAETMAAIVKRNFNKHHTIQDIIDDYYIPEIDGVSKDDESDDD